MVDTKVWRRQQARYIAIGIAPSVTAIVVAVIRSSAVDWVSLGGAAAFSIIGVVVAVVPIDPRNAQRWALRRGAELVGEGPALCARRLVRLRLVRTGAVTACIAWPFWLQGFGVVTHGTDTSGIIAAASVIGGVFGGMHRDAATTQSVASLRPRRFREFLDPRLKWFALPMGFSIAASAVQLAAGETFGPRGMDRWFSIVLGSSSVILGFAWAVWLGRRHRQAGSVDALIVTELIDTSVINSLVALSCWWVTGLLYQLPIQRNLHGNWVLIGILGTVGELWATGMVLAYGTTAVVRSRRISAFREVAA